jgi:membrane protease YdiL (CAAX protease family)
VQRPVWPVFVAFALATAALLVGSTILLQVRFGVQGAQHPIVDATLLNLSVLVTDVILVAAVLLAARPLTRARLRLVRGRARPLDVVLVAVGTVALADVIDSVAMLLDLYRSGSVATMKNAIAGAAGPSLVTTFLMVGVVGASVEELFFRGFMQTRLSERWRPWRAVVWTSFCFGLLHMDLVHSTEAFLIGLWLGHYTERTGSLWPAMAAHIANNTLSVAFQRLGLVSSSTLPHVLWGLGGLVLLLVCLIALRRSLAEPAAAPAVPLAAVD